MLIVWLRTALLFLLLLAAAGGLIFAALCGRLQRRLEQEVEREEDACGIIKS